MLLDNIAPAARELARQLNDWRPQRAVILGSGLNGLVDQVTPLETVPYAQLPGFPQTGVSGHSGCLYAGALRGVPVLVFQGRYHVYEGYSPWQVTAPVRLAFELGCSQLLLSNAAGGIAEELVPGDFMLVTDHLNLTGCNPLAGRPERAFVDLGRLYHQPPADSFDRPLGERGIALHRGVLAWMPGPSYETPAEVDFLENAGAAAVSMSTVPEAIVARRYGLQVVALALIANVASGRTSEPLEHREVLAAGRRAEADAARLIEQLWQAWPPLV